MFRAASRLYHLGNAKNVIGSAWPPSAAPTDACPSPLPALCLGLSCHWALGSNESADAWLWLVWRPGRAWGEQWFLGERWDRLSDSLQQTDRVTAQFEPPPPHHHQSILQTKNTPGGKRRRMVGFFFGLFFSFLGSLLPLPLYITLISTWPHSPPSPCWWFLWRKQLWGVLYSLVSL